MKVFRNGLTTGLLLQLAIGPVFFFIVNLAIQKTIFEGFAAVVGVTLGDYFYIALAILGIGKLLEHKRIKKIFGIVSSIVLILFGLMIINGAIHVGTSSIITTDSLNIFSSFASVFLLTISSPLTIVMWTSLFAAKTIEYNYTKKELFIFGFSAGLATFIFMGSAVIIFSLIKGTIPVMLIQILNIIVGCLLIAYGAIRVIKVLQGKK